MTFISQGQSILKTDDCGRVRIPKERREALLEEFEHSGLSGLKFAALAGVKYPTFALWVQKRRKARENETAELQRGGETIEGQSRGSIRFVEAVAEVEQGGRRGAALTIEFEGGGKVRIESASQLRLAAELLKMTAGCGGAMTC